MEDTGSRVVPQNKTDHPARRYRQFMQVPVLRALRIQIGSKTCIIDFSGLAFQDCGCNFDFPREVGVFCEV